MNRPIRRKIELALISWLTSKAAGTALEDISMVTSSGTTLAAELAYDADSTALPPSIEPAPPFLSVDAQVEADPDLPHVYRARVAVHVRVDATNEAGSRVTIDAILRDAHNIITEPADTDEPTADDNRECGALLAYLTKPDTAPDTRSTVFTPLAVYDLWTTGQADEDQDTIWDGQLHYEGTVQDMDAFEYPPAP